MGVRFDDSVSISCSFTGYRPSKLPFITDKSSPDYWRMYHLIEREVITLINKGILYFQSGMALGVDMLCAEIVLGLKKLYDIHLVCVIPCLNQYQGWKKEDIDTYKRIIASSSAVVQITDSPYSEGCMMKRNRYLVDTAQYLIAVFDGQKGGTMATVNYAKKSDRTVIILNPTDYSRVELVHQNEKGVLYV